jgi:hypothetical protein
MRDAEVEGAPRNRPLDLEGLVVAEVVPKAQRHGWKHQTAGAASSVGLDVIAVLFSEVGHVGTLSCLTH